MNSEEKLKCKINKYEKEIKNTNKIINRLEQEVKNTEDKNQDIINE